MSSAITIEQLCTEPSLMLQSIDFHKRMAVFCRVPPGVPNEHCDNALQFGPIRAPLAPLLEFHSRCSAAAPPLRFVWMTDFCGSTLLAKGLNEAPGLYLYNEPRAFADLAVARRYMDAGLYDFPLDLWRSLLRFALSQHGKVFSPGDVALIKEWPLSNYILHDILGASSDHRGVFLYASLRDYLNKCLKSQARRQLARDRVSKIFIEIPRNKTLARVDISRLTDSQAAALHWLHLMYWHRDQGYAEHQQLRTLASEAFFTDRADSLRKAAVFFGCPLSVEAVEQIVAGPVFQRYSKQASASFSMEERAKRDADTEQRFAKEIAAGLNWANEITDADPLPVRPGPALPAV